MSGVISDMQEVVMQEKALVRWKPFLIGGGMILF